MKNFVCLLFTAAVALTFAGCVSYDYEGKMEPPVKAAKDIRIYNDSGAIGKSYTVLGTAVVSGNSQDVSRDRMIEKLRSEAHKCGATAILIVEQQLIPTGTASGSQPFMTAFDYDDTSSSWRQIYQDVDQNFSNTRRVRNNHSSSGSSRRIIRAEFIRCN